LEPLLWAALFVLAASFLSNVSPFVGASYTLLATVELTFLGFTVVNFLLVILVSAVGATLAKLAIYFGAFEFKGRLAKNRNVRLLGRFSSTRGFYLVLFVAALIPVFPFDDLIYIGAAATSASLGIMISVTLWAKILKSLIEISLEFTVLRGLATILGGSQILLTLALTAVFIVIGVLLYKVDWELALNRLGVDVAGPHPV
jgi:hypothetical protein